MGRKKIEVVKGYKATDKDMKCRDFQYKIGKEYKEDKAELCNSGFHFCENPLDILNYYNLCESRFFEVEAKEVSEQKQTDDTKRVSKRIKLKTELNLKDLISLSFNYINEKATIKNDDEILKNDEDNSQVATSGDNSQVATSGDNSQVATSGYNSQVATSGYNSKVATSGDNSQVATSGDNSQVATSGYNSQVATSGYNSKVATSGNYSQVATSGDNSQVAINGEYSVGMCAGMNCEIKGKKGNWITLAEWEWNDEKDVYVLLCVKSAQIDGEILKEDTYYKLKDGEFVEC